jgi:hypothetical protein
MFFLPGAPELSSPLETPPQTGALRVFTRIGWTCGCVQRFLSLDEIR